MLDWSVAHAMTSEICLPVERAIYDSKVFIEKCQRTIYHARVQAVAPSVLTRASALANTKRGTTESSNA
jgi:hypothetical protein